MDLAKKLEEIRIKAYQSLPTPPELCPKSRLGHSYRTLSRTDQDVTQRCRFCQQQRTVPLYHARQPRQKSS